MNKNESWVCGSFSVYVCSRYGLRRRFGLVAEGYRSFNRRNVYHYCRICKGTIIIHPLEICQINITHKLIEGHIYKVDNRPLHTGDSPSVIEVCTHPYSITFPGANSEYMPMTAIVILTKTTIGKGKWSMLHMRQNDEFVSISWRYYCNHSNCLFMLASSFSKAIKLRVLIPQLLPECYHSSMSLNKRRYSETTD